MNQEWIGFSGYGSIGNVAGLYENSWEMEPGKEERSGAYKMENYINLKKENGVNENYQIAWKLTDAVFKNDGKKYKMKNDIGLIMIIK